MDPIETATRELVAALRAEIAAANTREPEPDRLLGIPDAAAALGIGRSMLYEEIARGRIRTVLIGRRRLVPSGAVRDYIEAA
jgi:excisionase family DNA binding protein